MNKFILSLALIISINTFGQTKDAYKIYKINGRKTSYRKLLKECKKADMVFFGEEHDNPVAHWLEIELTKDLHKKVDKPIILAAEMMESDNQKQVDLYVITSYSIHYTKLYEKSKSKILCKTSLG